MYRYRNANTGDEVQRPERWPRLDALPNWTLITEPAEETVPDEPDEQSEGPPARSAPKKAWEAYAVATGQLTDAEAHAWSKAELIDRFGRRRDGG